MKTKEERIELLLKMQEHPEDYMEEQLQQLLNNEDCRQIYEMMRWSEEAFLLPDTGHTGTLRRSYFGTWHKVAAACIGFILLGGLVFAAYRIQSSRHESRQAEPPATMQKTTADDTQGVKPSSAAAEKTPTTVIFSDKSLPEILSAMATFYHVSVDFRTPEASHLRLFYKWQQGNSIENVVEDLNHFDRVSLRLEGNTLIVE